MLLKPANTYHTTLVRAPCTMTPHTTHKYPNKDKRAVSSITAVLLLILISVASSLAIYWLLASFSNNVEEASMASGSSLVEVEQVTPVLDEAMPGKCYALDVVVRNVETAEASLSGGAIYIRSPGEDSPKAWLWWLDTRGGDAMVLRPGEAFELRLFSSEAVPPGRYILTILASGLQASGVFLLPCSLGESTLFQVHTSNDSSSPVTGEYSYARYELWSGPWDSYYKIEFRIYAKEGVTLHGARAELFNSTLQHPAWVGGNPWHYTSPFT